MIQRDKTKEKVLIDHIAWAKQNSLCDQCIYPWHDGICDCGEFNTFKVQLAYNVSSSFILQKDYLKDLS